jgi:potassium-dependent mechanosensitive channel
MTPMKTLAKTLFTFALCISLFAHPISAQSNNASKIDYNAWQSFATRIEEAVEAGRASDTILENVRTDLSDWRAKFVSAKDANARTITAVQAQISALGPAPENGLEPPEIVEQRASLNSRLAELVAPGKRAEVAQSRADALIVEIDRILAQRQANAFMERTSSPLNPTIWSRSWNALNSTLTSTRSEVVNGWNNRNQREAFTSNLPALLASTSVSIVFLLLGWRWVRALSMRFVRHRNTAKGWLTAFVLSLVQLVVASVGLLGLVNSIYLTEFVGLRLDPLLDAIIEGGFFIIISIWLSAFVFARADRSFQSFALSESQNASGRHSVISLGLIFGASFILDELARYDNWSDDAKAVLYFPLVLMGGLFLWRLGRLLRQHSMAASAELGEGEQARYIDRMYGLLGRVIVLIGMLGPLLMAIGYFEAGTTIVFQTIETLILIAMLILAQRVLAELWVVLRRGIEEARDGLVPTLAGFGLMLFAIPELLRIWGMSDARITEFWTRAREGFTVGETRITAGAFLTFAIVFAIGYIITRLVQGALKNTVLPKTRMDQGGQTALVSGVGYIGIFLAALGAITGAGIDLSSLAIVAGALSVGIGFGLQNIVSNFVSGIILLIERPISEGDWIEVGGTHGTVRDISVRSTRIETFDRSDVILPNADLISGKVTNYTRGNTVGRVIVPVGVAYGNDTRRIEKILLEVAENHPMVLANPKPNVIFQGFGADSLDFEIRAILRDVNFVLSVRSDMNHEIARRFTEENIEIPFGQRDIWIRNPEVLGAALAPAPKPKPKVKSKTKTNTQKMDTTLLSDSDFEGPENGTEDGGDR